MRFEEVLPALREGKKVKSSNWKDSYFIFKELNDNGPDYLLGSGSIGFRIELMSTEDILNSDWEIYEEPKKKVKYYPALLKLQTYLGGKGFVNIYFVSSTPIFFKDFEDAKKHFKDKTDLIPIRLITEIPELIEEREE